MLPPSLAKHIDDLMRSDLLYWRDLWFARLLAATKIVVFGLILEGPELVCEIKSIVGRWWFSRKFRFSLPEMHIPEWVKVLAFLGWMLIVGGVAGEWITDAIVSDGNANLESFNSTSLEAAVRESGSARASAVEAAEASARARRDSAAAIELAKGARIEADSFEQDIVSAKKQAADAESHLADALQRAADAKRESVDATRELLKLKTPRSLSDEQQKRIASKIKPFAGTPFDLWVTPDSESTALLESIDAMLRFAEWKFNSPAGAGVEYGEKAGLNTGSGIDLHVPIEHEAEWGPAIIALGDALSAEGIDARPLADTAETFKHMKRDRIHVVVGSKPVK